MDSDASVGEEVQRGSGRPAQQNGSSDGPSKPAFKMPDPPKKKAMAPPPPRFSAAPQQTGTASHEQASALGSTPDALQAKPHATSDRPAEPSPDAQENAEGGPKAVLQSPATAKSLPQPAAKTGAAFSCSAHLRRTCHVCMQECPICPYCTSLWPEHAGCLVTALGTTEHIFLDAVQWTKQGWQALRLQLLQPRM